MFKGEFDKKVRKLATSEGPSSISPQNKQNKIESNFQTSHNTIKPQAKLVNNKEMLGKRNHFTFQDIKTEKSLYVETGLGTTMEFFQGRQDFYSIWREFSYIFGSAFKDKLNHIDVKFKCVVY